MLTEKKCISEKMYEKNMFEGQTWFVSFLSEYIQSNSNLGCMHILWCIFHVVNVRIPVRLDRFL